MPDKIQDGAGESYLAQVNSKNQLVTRSTAVKSVHEKALLGDAYGTRVLFEQQVADTWEMGGYFLYTGTKMLVFSDFLLATDEPNTCHMLVRVQPYILSGGVAGFVGNTNTSSSKSLNCTFTTQNDGAAPYTLAYDGFDFIDVILVGGGTYNLDGRDAILMRPGLSFGYWFKCTNADSIVRLASTCFEIDMEKGGL